MTDHNRDSDGWPSGSFWVTKGPGKYEFLIDGLLIRPDGEGSQMFVIDNVDVPIRIMGARKTDFWSCPELPDEFKSRMGPFRDWADAWEFTGYVPGYAIGVRAVYSPVSRLGRFDLWGQSTQEYTCGVAKQDLERFFYCTMSDGTAEAALRRVMIHMTRGNGVIGGQRIHCHVCWDVYAAMKFSAKAQK